jgi:hypothetical protein
MLLSCCYQVRAIWIIPPFLLGPTTYRSSNTFVSNTEVAFMRLQERQQQDHATDDRPHEKEKEMF